MNAHREEWLGSSTTTVHGKTTLDIASSSGCEQVVTETTHIDGGVLDLVLTYVHDLVDVQVGSTVGTSDHSAIFIDIVLTWYVDRSSI